MGFYDRLADLSVVIKGVRFDSCERETSRGTTRRTTIISIDGPDKTGYGEDVTYDPDEHDALLDRGSLDIAGDTTVGSVSDRLGTIDMFPNGAPDRAVFRRYRRWAVESAILDLALRQAGTDLGAVLDRAYDPVRFVVSTGLGDPPSADPVTDWLDIDPTLEFKLDASPEWPPALIEEIAAMDRVRILDFKDQSKGRTDGNGDPAFYRRIGEAFPNALLEDPVVTPATRDVLRPMADRVTWDSPILDTEAVEALPWEPHWLNIKPSRFGTLERVLDCIEHCLERDIALYGGGQFELGVGRNHLHVLAALFYPDGPNDVAPRGYNDPEPHPGVPASPLPPPGNGPGFRWSDTN